MRLAKKNLRIVIDVRRKQTAKRLQAALEDLIGRGLSPERMAVDLQVCKETIESWLRGHRCPKFPTVRYIEQLYGVQIEPRTTEPVIAR